MPDEVTKADAIDDIERVADVLGHPPTVSEYREHGQYSRPTVARHFEGSFTAARAAACGGDGGRQPEHRREDLLADLQRVAAIVDGEPARGDYETHGEYALSTITYRFESWVEAKREAGVYDGAFDGPGKAELIEDLQGVDAEQSGPLSQKVYDEHGEWTSMTAKRRFPSWEAACQKAGVSRPIKGPRVQDDGELYDDIRRIAEDLGRAPTKKEYDERGAFSQQMAKNRAGSWNDAVRRAGFEPRIPGASPGELNGNWKGGYEPYYGSNWHNQRRAARRRDGYECVVCGMTEGEHLGEFGWGLEVHHITPVREFDEPEDANTLDNLVTLCRPHHIEFEKRPATELERERRDG